MTSALQRPRVKKHRYYTIQKDKKINGIQRKTGRFSVATAKKTMPWPCCAKESGETRAQLAALRIAGSRWPDHVLAVSRRSRREQDWGAGAL
jgi:hypothetical protein